MLQVKRGQSAIRFFGAEVHTFRLVLGLRRRVEKSSVLAHSNAVTSLACCRGHEDEDCYVLHTKSSKLS